MKCLRKVEGGWEVFLSDNEIERLSYFISDCNNSGENPGDEVTVSLSDILRLVAFARIPVKSETDGAKSWVNTIISESVNDGRPIVTTRDSLSFLEKTALRGLKDRVLDSLQTITKFERHQCESFLKGIW